MSLELVNPNTNDGRMSARGDCPHCHVRSLFTPVSNPHIVVIGNQVFSNSMLQCQSCQRIILLVAFRVNVPNALYLYQSHQPVFSDDGAVSELIPENIRNDFKEALRCKSVTALKATVTMCRRALQASCKGLGAQGRRLIDQIDDLGSKGQITRALKDMAHQIRSIGNDGAHPDDDGLNDVTSEDADDVVEFTKQYFDHIYVMPARMTQLVARRTSGSSK